MTCHLFVNKLNKVSDKVKFSTAFLLFGELSNGEKHSATGTKKSLKSEYFQMRWQPNWILHFWVTIILAFLSVCHRKGFIYGICLPDFDRWSAFVSLMLIVSYCIGTEPSMHVLHNAVRRPVIMLHHIVLHWIYCNKWWRDKNPILFPIP